MQESVLEYFPENIKSLINIEQELLEEIRLRCEKPIILKYSEKEILLNYILQRKDIEYIFERICENSIYTYQNQICNRLYNNTNGA